MEKDKCFLLGYVSKKHGYKGEFNVKLETNLHYKNLDYFFIKLNENLVPFFIESFRLKKENIALVKLEDINSENEVQGLKGKEIYIPLKFLIKKQNELHDLINFEVIDLHHGNIGRIIHVLDNSLQDIFQVKNGNKEILIPINNNLIQKIENKTVYIETPRGLIDLYL